MQAALDARQRLCPIQRLSRKNAAVLDEAGTITPRGCNVENAAYPATICAERVALTAAVAGGRGPFVAIAVATENGGSPCGTCRQVMAGSARA
ncbi:MAG: hypothetical protein R2838_25360 [Caldilineaceae bacterium]